MPATRMPCPTVGLATAVAIAFRSNEPENPYSSATPNRKNADEKAPSRKYFSAASWDSSRRRRAMPHIRYSGSENTSSATNMVIRSDEAGNTIMPPRANRASGKTSVCSSRAADASASARLPGTVAADAANVLTPPLSWRSANTRIATRPNTSRAPHMK